MLGSHNCGSLKRSIGLFHLNKGKNKLAGKYSKTWTASAVLRYRHLKNTGSAFLSHRFVTGHRSGRRRSIRTSFQPCCPAWECVVNLHGHHDFSLPAGIAASLAAHSAVPRPGWGWRSVPAEVSATVTWEQPSTLGQSSTATLCSCHRVLIWWFLII